MVIAVLALISWLGSGVRREHVAWAQAAEKQSGESWHTPEGSQACHSPVPQPLHQER